MLHFRFILILFPLGLVGCVSLGPPAPPPVVVETRPTKIEHRTFAAGHPPPHLIEMVNGFAAACCETIFGCDERIHYMMPRYAFTSVTATIDSVELDPKQQIIVWMPEDGRPEWLAHEETHRAIAEHYYASAEIVARRIAAQAVGRKVLIPGQNSKANAEEAIGAVEQELVTAYFRETRDRCEYAQARFDEVTDHGREPIGNGEAMTRALADENAHWAVLQTGAHP